MHSRTRRHALLSMLGLAALPLAADEPKPVTPAYNTMTDEQEITLGRDAAKQIEKEEKLKLIEVPSLTEYVDHVFHKIVKTSRRPNLPYSIKIVDTADINAFSLPGGPCYIFRGLMQFACNESEMMGVLAHEVGHVVGRHGANNHSRENSADSLVSEASRVLFGDDAPGKLVKSVGSPVVALALLKYNRDQESEADLLGFYNLQRAGWSPKGMPEFFQRLDDTPAGIQSVFALAQGHPAPADRAEAINEEMRRYPPSDKLTVNSEEFKSMQAELKKLPPPPKPKPATNDN